ncbi:hypothetical protein ACGF07_12330 [Kitasatospora sp. NPDC048194]|uniref:hypothetical protein n=1 Tax=Kitasatospora sp. NPDC048194 TaxID=3364045 RepID=UPI0037116861
MCAPHPHAFDYLLRPGDFSLDAYPHGEEVVPTSGEALEVVVTFGAGAEAAEQYLEDEPGLFGHRDAAATALSPEVTAVAEALGRLRKVASGLGERYVLPDAADGSAYAPLFRP